MKARIKKKIIKKSILIYDLCTLPYRMDMRKIHRYMVESGIVLYDSSRGATKPVIYPRVNAKAFKFVDVNDKFDKDEYMGNID